MNIFVTDPDPVLSAFALDDMRVNAMIRESAQLLSTAVHLNSPYGVHDRIYLSTHENHPCAKWVRASRANFEWLLHHALSLTDVYTLARDRIHGTTPILVTLADYRQRIPAGDLTPFANCTVYPNTANVFLAYRRALLDKWAKDHRPPTWLNRNIPNFAKPLFQGVGL